MLMVSIDSDRMNTRGEKKKNFYELTILRNIQTKSKIFFETKREREKVSEREKGIENLTFTLKNEKKKNKESRLEFGTKQ